MSPTTQQLLTSALTLPESERLELAEALLAASEPPPPEPTGEAWLAELHRQSAQIDGGEAALAPWPEVKQRARAQAAWPLGRRSSSGRGPAWRAGPVAEV